MPNTASYDLIDDPTYEFKGFSISTADIPRRSRLYRVRAYWGVYYHGRLLHGGLHITEVYEVRRWYAEGVPANDPRWQTLTTPGKQPSPSTDHRRKAGLS